ncbi:MAG: porphobilinogen synthase [Dehalococcoidia bacterium]
MGKTFPDLRLRRLRRTESMRNLVKETSLSPENFIYPIFIIEGQGIKKEVPSMPGIHQLSLDLLPEEVEEVARLAISAVILFGIPETKNEMGSEAYNPNGVIQKGVEVVKKTAPHLVVITDVCLCEYTSHGHCGVVVDGYVDHDKTLELLAKTALSHAQAGADIVGPSNMMDGNVSAIRAILDQNGFELTPIMSYAAKYASSFYGPFRDAAQSTPSFGDRRSYQMNTPNVREAMQEIEMDIQEGADMIMVKPALAYLDVIAKARATFNYPLAAYNVSGEYAMVKAAAQEGWIDERRITMEILIGIKRAGADVILTYHAKEVARWLAEERAER